jgi:DUF438 domain-containing protein
VASKKESLKQIIRSLHAGLSAEEARRRVLDEVGSIETKELVQIEQELIDEGLPAEEVSRFCNVHVLLVKDFLQKGAGPGSLRPVELLKRENAVIQDISQQLRALAAATGKLDLDQVGSQLGLLQGLERHYGIKENVIFPYLERRGFPGPSKVMWQKDNEVRALYKAAAAELARDRAGQGSEVELRGALLPLLDEVEGMVTKEEQILFPAAAERLSADEWARIAIEIDELGSGFGVGSERASASAVAAQAEPRAASAGGGSVELPSGSLSATELEALLNALPFDITFVDADDKVRYFTEGKDRVFMRTRAVIGRPVRNCHPPKSLAAVEKVMEELRSGKADHRDFWIELGGKSVFIRYYAVRDAAGKYLGTMEVTQDITEARALKGEKRLV